jgi:hypothetical protein
VTLAQSGLYSTVKVRDAWARGLTHLRVGVRLKRSPGHRRSHSAPILISLRYVTVISYTTDTVHLLYARGVGDARRVE